MAERQLTGKIDRSNIGRLELPPIPQRSSTGFARSSRTFRASSPTSSTRWGRRAPYPLRCCGRSTRGRDRRPGADAPEHRAGRQPLQRRIARISRLAEIEAHNLAEPGDVLVIEGVHDVSNIGGISASIGKRQGEIGAIVDGSVRDVAECRKLGYPMWSRGVSPLTGKWRIQTVQINHLVEIAGVQVAPGDIVIADETGICFVPPDIAPAVLERAREIYAAEKPGRRTSRRACPSPTSPTAPAPSPCRNRTRIFSHGTCRSGRRRRARGPAARCSSTRCWPKARTSPSACPARAISARSTRCTTCRTASA